MNRSAPELLTVQVSFTIRKRGGRKEMILPQAISRPVTHSRSDSTVVKALARAFRWKRMIDSGDFATTNDLAHHERIAASYLTRVLRLTLLSPETVETILLGRCPVELANLLEPFPMNWQDQMTSWR